MSAILFLPLYFLVSVAVFAADDASPIKLNPGYVHGTYGFTGKVLTVNGTFTSTHTFTGKATPDSLFLEWKQDMGSFKSSGTVVIDTRGGTVNMAGMADQRFDDPMMAIAAATGVSGGSAHLIYALWTGKRDEVFPHTDITIAKEGGKTTVTGIGRVKSLPSSVILSGDELLTYISEMAPPTKGANDVTPKLTDEEIRQTLTMMKKPVNDHEIAKMRDQMRQADDAVKNMTDKITWTTTIEVTGLTFNR